MTISIVSALPEDIPAIREFNRRLELGHAGFQFPESPRSLGVPREAGAPLWHELYVAKDGADVRAGYALKRELLHVSASREPIELWNYQIPLSEGVVNKKYATIGIRLLQDAMGRQAHLYCLGMGSLSRPLPRLLERFKWTVEEAPFRFRVIRAKGFLSNIAFLRTTKGRRFALDIARLTGAGAFGVFIWKIISSLRSPKLPRGFEAKVIESFGVEADSMFARFSSFYGALVDRTAAALNVRFPISDERLIRIVIQTPNELVGWVVLSHSQCRSHKQFGDMQLGCIVDGLCSPLHAGVLIRLATDFLRTRGVDLIVSNQTHTSWLSGLRSNGFLAGPSNFIFARSPSLRKDTPDISDWHINRGDGDGPINL